MVSDAAYGDWYVWARRNLSNDAGVCHAAAAAAAEVERRGGARDEAVAAARATVTSGAHLQAPDPDAARRRAYAEWFDWARRELGGLREQQHAAARAALAAMEAGAGPAGAAAAARDAFGLGASPAPANAPQPPPPQPPPPPPGALAPPAWHTPGEAVPAPPAAYASFWRRLLAYAVDYAVLTAAIFVLAVAVGVVLGLALLAQGRQMSASDPRVVLPLDAIAIAITWGYYTLLESSTWQATLGKRLLHMRVTDEAGRRISWGRANGRYFGKILSSLGLGIGYLWIAFSARHQGWHDVLAHTLVVRTEGPAARTE